MADNIDIVEVICVCVVRERERVQHRHLPPSLLLSRTIVYDSL